MMPGPMNIKKETMNLKKKNHNYLYFSQCFKKILIQEVHIPLLNIFIFLPLLFASESFMLFLMV